MNRLAFASLVCFMLMSSCLLADPIVSIGTFQLPSVDSTQRIPIMVSSASHEHIAGVDLYVQIADGGPVNGGSATAPRIVGLDLTGPGTIFNASNKGAATSFLGQGANNNPPYLIAEADTITASGDLEANGVLAYLSVNTFGAALGSYRVKVQDVGENVASGPWTTDFGISSAAFSDDGWIVVVAEPSTFVSLLLVLGLCLGRRIIRTVF